MKTAIKVLAFLLMVALWVGQAHAQVWSGTVSMQGSGTAASWQTGVSVGLTGNDTNGVDFCARIYIPANASAYTGTGSQIRATLFASTTNAFGLSGASICKADVATPPNCDTGTLKRFQFSKAYNVDITANTSVVTDALNFVYTKGSAYIITLYSDGTHINYVKRATGQSGYVLYYKGTCGADDSQSETVTGYFTDAGTVQAISAIEVYGP